MKKDPGYIPINRNFFSHPFWLEKRKFSKAEAWVDLVQSARFADNPGKELINGKWVTWNRGELPASLRFLAKRWSWSKSKVEKFLDLLEKEDMISTSSNAGQTILSLNNYENFNKKGQPEGRRKGQRKPLQAKVSSDLRDSEKDTEKETEGTVEGQQKDKTNKENKGNKENNLIDICRIFYDNEKSANEDEPFISQYKAMVDFLFGLNENHKPCRNIFSMKEQISYKQYLSIKSHSYAADIPISDILNSMENYAELAKKNINAGLTALNWIKRSAKTKKMQNA